MANCGNCRARASVNQLINCHLCRIILFKCLQIVGLCDGLCPGNLYSHNTHRVHLCNILIVKCASFVSFLSSWVVPVSKQKEREREIVEKIHSIVFVFYCIRCCAERMLVKMPLSPRLPSIVCACGASVPDALLTRQRQPIFRVTINNGVKLHTHFENVLCWCDCGCERALSSALHTLRVLYMLEPIGVTTFSGLLFTVIRSFFCFAFAFSWHSLTTWICYMHICHLCATKQKTHFTYACNTLNVWISGALESFSIACYLLILIQDAESEFVDSLHIVFLVSTALRLRCYTIAHAQRRIWIMWPLTSNIWCNNSSNY